MTKFVSDESKEIKADFDPGFRSWFCSFLEVRCRFGEAGFELFQLKIEIHAAAELFFLGGAGAEVGDVAEEKVPLIEGVVDHAGLGVWQIDRIGAGDGGGTEGGEAVDP